MNIKVTDAIDVGEIVWEWTEIHPEVKMDGSKLREGFSK